MSDAVQRRFYDLAYAAPGVSTSRIDGLIRSLEVHRVDAALSLVSAGRTLLDVGCGGGSLLAKASARFEWLSGVDVSEVQLAEAQRNLARGSIANVSLAHANADRGLPFGSSQFDVVTAIAVLALVFDPIAALDEIRRVLRPGGILVVEALNLVYLPRRLAVLTGHLPVHTTCHGWEGGHLHNFTRASLIDLLRSRGFHVERSTGSGVLMPLRTWWPGLLLGNVIVRARV